MGLASQLFDFRSPLIKSNDRGIHRITGTCRGSSLTNRGTAGSHNSSICITVGKILGNNLSHSWLPLVLADRLVNLR